jgi:hypothetical protein
MWGCPNILRSNEVMGDSQVLTDADLKILGHGEVRRGARRSPAVFFLRYGLSKRAAASNVRKEDMRLKMTNDK